ncbi:MAG: hypothetical protein RL235_555 [Chlamydiota bacterium]|jgi:hypothetical protein
MFPDRLRSHFEFALSKEHPRIRQEIPIYRLEKIGNRFSWLVYDFRTIMGTYLGDPRFVTICFTLFFMTLTALLFYPSNTWDILEQMFTWIIKHIEWKYVRFGLWLLSEITILGLGLRALGRFSNPQLMKFHGIT